MKSNFQVGEKASKDCSFLKSDSPPPGEAHLEPRGRLELETYILWKIKLLSKYGFPVPFGPRDPAATTAWLMVTDQVSTKIQWILDSPVQYSRSPWKCL